MPQNQIMMSKSTPKKNSRNNEKLQVKQKSESVITIKSNLKDVSGKQEQIDTMDSEVKKELKLDLLQDFPMLATQTKRAKSVILGSTTYTKKNLPKTRKRTTVWTKFLAGGETETEIETAPKVQKTKPTSVYKPGTSFSDVLFSAGPCSTVNIKSVPTEIVAENTEGPSVISIENFPTPDQKVYGFTKSKLKRGKQLSGSHLYHGKVKEQLIEEVAETKPKIEIAKEKKTVEELVQIQEDTVSEANTIKTKELLQINSLSESNNLEEVKVQESSAISSLEKLKFDPLPENFESDVLLKIKSTNKLDLPCLNDGPSSSDDNVNVSESSESGSESNSTLDSPKISLKKPETETSTSFQLTLKSKEAAQVTPIKYDIPETQYFAPRQNEKPADTFYGIPWWNFTNPFSGPEIFPRHTRQFNDETFLYAEDLANLALKLARGK